MRWQAHGLRDGQQGSAVLLCSWPTGVVRWRSLPCSPRSRRWLPIRYPCSNGCVAAEERRVLSTPLLLQGAFPPEFRKEHKTAPGAKG